VRKWLVGESIPTQAKLLILSRMVGADPNWLRFGDGEAEFTPVESTIEQREVFSAVMGLGRRELRAVLALALALRGAA
jgi:hypothetical protein